MRKKVKRELGILFFLLYDLTIYNIENGQHIFFGISLLKFSYKFMGNICFHIGA